VRNEKENSFRNARALYGSKVPADEIERIASQFIRPYLDNPRRMNFIEHEP